MAQMVRTSPFSFCAAAASAQGVDGAVAGFSAEVLPGDSPAAAFAGGNWLVTNGRTRSSAAHAKRARTLLPAAVVVKLARLRLGRQKPPAFLDSGTVLAVIRSALGSSLLVRL